MKKVIIAMTLFLVGAISSQAQAQGRHHHSIRHEQVNQNQRIKEGVKSGELTHREAAGLHGQQKRIQRHKRIAQADGRVTPMERRHLRDEQARASRDIYRHKHNKQVR